MSRVKKSRSSKFLALVVALTFLLSVAAPAFAAAPADLQQSEAARLQTLGIIEGFPDGTLGLDQTMTRAEFAKVVTIATGNEIIADAMVNSPTKFSDAKVGVWYTGYVNVASELGYIIGYPDGTFKPNQAITNAEVLTILLRALGYDDRLPGSWPTDYLVKANELGITDDVTFAAKAAALRGDAFIFTSRTLDTNMVKWDGDAGEFVERDPATTLLAKAFQGTTDEGVLVDLNWDDEILMATFATVDDNAVKTAEYEVVSTPVISGAEGILGLLANEVSYIINSDDQVIYLGAQETRTVTDDAITLNDKAEIDDKTYDLISGYELRAFPGEVPDASDGTYEADRVTAVLDSGDIMAVLFEEYENPGIVDEVNDEYITVLGAAGDVDLEDAEYAVIKDGAFASLADLEAGDLIYVDETGAHGLDYLIVAVGQDNAITGTLERANADFSKITVEGTEYDVDKTDGELNAIASSDGGEEYDNWPTNDASDFVGEEVAILLSPVGKVAAITSGFEAEAGLYGILLDAEYVGFDEVQVKLLTAAGDEAIYNVDEDAVVDSVYLDDSKTVFAPLNTLVSYSFNSAGEIDSITVIDNKAEVKDADKDGNRIKLDVGLDDDPDERWYRVTDTTAFFGWGSDTENDWTTTTWSNFADVTGTVYYDLDGNTVTAIAFEGQVTTKGDYGVILGSGYDADGDYYELIVFGDVVTYNLASGQSLNEKYIGKVCSFELNADNEITRVEVVDKDNIKAELGVGYSFVSGTVDNFSARNYIEVDEAYYDLDAETSIVDVTDPANPEIKSSVRRGDKVELYIDDEGFVDYILIVPGVTPPGEDEEEEEVVTVTYIVDNGYNVEAFNRLKVTDANDEVSYLELADFDTFVFANGVTIDDRNVFAAWANAQTSDFVIDVDVENKTIEVRAEYGLADLEEFGFDFEFANGVTVDYGVFAAWADAQTSDFVIVVDSKNETIEVKADYPLVTIESAVINFPVGSEAEPVSATITENEIKFELMQGTTIKDVVVTLSEPIPEDQLQNAAVQVSYGEIEDAPYGTIELMEDGTTLTITPNEGNETAAVAGETTFRIVDADGNEIENITDEFGYETPIPAIVLIVTAAENG